MIIMNMLKNILIYSCMKYLKNMDDKLPKGMSDDEYRNKKTKYKFTENFSSFKLNESPDYINSDLSVGLTHTIYYEDPDTYAFGIFDGELLIVQEDTHGALGYKRDQLDFTGRLWTEHKIISFWEYPESYEELKKIITKINDKSSVEINDGWLIDIVVDDKNEFVEPKNKDWYTCDYETKLIKISEYVGSEKRSAAQLAKNHLEVGKGGAKKGWGSKYYDDKLPKGMSLAQYRNKKTKNKFTESFSSFIDKIEEKLSIDEQRTDVSGKVERSKKLVDMKEKILPLLTTNSKYNNGRVFDLKGFSNKGCSLGADKDGFFCYTHRARSKSYEEPSKIPQKDIKFIKSTG